jgi:sigma-B regulation protein RsbU (phosphoserine phosphatase)
MRDGRMLFWIADATGHGAAAALLTTLAKLLFHHANGENDTPAGIMHAVDRDFRSILGARSFMTAMCVALDVKRGAGTIVGAGDGATESIASTSPPLGLVAASNFTETEMELRGGDLFLLYTDGLYGVGEGDDRRLAPATVAQRLLSAPGNAQSALRDFLRQTAPTPSNVVPPDDIAALAVRRL